MLSKVENYQDMSKNNVPTSRKVSDDLGKKYGHENPHMASKNNVLPQKSPPRAKLFGPGVILPWAFLFRRILCLSQRIRIFSSAVVM